MDPINFEPVNNGPDVTLGVTDPNHTSAQWAEGGGPFAGKDVPQNGMWKNTQTDMSGPSGMAQVQDASHPQGLGSNSLNYNPVVNDSASLPVAPTVDVMTFGDPNDTSLDFKDGSNPNTVTLGGGKSNDISRYGFNQTTAQD